jgi:hypothetical protein
MATKCIEVLPDGRFLLKELPQSSAAAFAETPYAYSESELREELSKTNKADFVARVIADAKRLGCTAF